MATDHVEYARACTDLRGNALLIMLDLAAHANQETDLCWPSIERLALRSRVSERQTQRIIQKLIAAGHIERIQAGNGRGNRSVYRLPKKGDTSSVKGDTIASSFESVKGDISDTERVTLLEERVTYSPLKGDTAMSPELEVNKNQLPIGNSERSREADMASESEIPTARPQPTSSVIKIDSPYLPKGLQLPGRYVPAGTGENAVQVYYERFRVDLPDERLSAPQEDDLVRKCSDLRRLREVIIAYSRNGQYKPRNVQLILDWYRAGIPNKHRSNKHGAYQQNGKRADRQTEQNEHKPAVMDGFTAEEIEGIRQFSKSLVPRALAPA